MLHSGEIAIWTKQDIDLFVSITTVTLLKTLHKDFSIEFSCFPATALGNF